MSEDVSQKSLLNRRRFLALTAAGAGAVVLAACGAEATPTTAPPAATATQAGPASTPTEVPRSVGGSTPTAAAGGASAAPAASAAGTARASTAPSAAPSTAASAAPANLADKQIFRYCDIEPPSFDPGVGSSPYNMPQIFDGLLGVNWKDGSFDLLVGESYQANADATAYTFKLKSGQKWSDGSPLTAKDFEYSWQRVMDPKTASKYTAALLMIKNGA